MGELPERAAKAASDGLVASSQAGGPQGGRAATAASSRLTIQVFRYDDDECVAVAPGSAGSNFFLILVEAGTCETTTAKSGVTIDVASLADHCPRWRQYAFKPIAANEGLAAVVRNHIAVLAEQEASIDAMASAAMRPMTVALVAALLNALDGATDLSSLPEFHRRRIREYILQHLCNPMLDVEMIARGVGLSVRYIHHLFQNEPASLMQWAHMKRLERCRELIVDRRLRHRKISQIAYDAGFNDLAHFSRCFRKRFQLSPSQARAAAPA
jgi:AraC family transcriptional activator of tynA and feaB